MFFLWTHRSFIQSSNCCKCHFSTRLARTWLKRQWRQKFADSQSTLQFCSTAENRYFHVSGCSLSLATFTHSISFVIPVDTEILSDLSRNDSKCIPMNKKLTSSHLIFIYSFSRVNLWTKTETRPETPKSNRILFLQKNNSSISSQAIIRNDNVLKLYVNADMCGYGSPISDKYPSHIFIRLMWGFWLFVPSSVSILLFHLSPFSLSKMEKRYWACLKLQNWDLVAGHEISISPAQIVLLQ